MMLGVEGMELGHRVEDVGFRGDWARSLGFGEKG